MVAPELGSISLSSGTATCVCKHKSDSIVEREFRFECNSSFGRSRILLQAQGPSELLNSFATWLQLKSERCVLSPPSLHLGPSRQLVDEGRETFILIALGAVAPAGG